MSRCLLVVALVAAAIAQLTYSQLNRDFRCLESRHLVGGEIEYTRQNCSASAICSHQPCGCMLTRTEHDGRTEYACDYESDKPGDIPDSCHIRTFDFDEEDWRVKPHGTPLGQHCYLRGVAPERVWRCCCMGALCNLPYKDNGTLDALIAPATTPAPAR